MKIFSKYFGEPKGGWGNYDANYAQSYTTFDLPDALKGSNLFLRDTLDNEILEGSEEWPTTVALPYLRTNEINVKLSRSEFDRTIIGEVPHRSLSRLLRQSKTTFEGSTVRKGLGFIIELDFHNSPDGDANYYKCIVEIAKNVQLSHNFDTLVALVSCKDRRAHISDYFLSETSFHSLLDHEVNVFACAADPKESYRIQVEQYKRNMPDKTNLIMITGPSCKVYLTLSEHHKATYMSLGPDGAARTMDGPASDFIISPGLPVYEAPDMPIGENGDKTQVLNRPVSIGEYNIMGFADHREENLTDKYKKAWRDIYIYNNNADDFKKVSFRDAFCNSGVFDKADWSDNMKDQLDYYRRVRQRKYDLASSMKKHRSNPLVSDDDNGYDDDDGSFFLFAETDGGECILPEYFGQFPSRAASDRDLEQVAETIISKIKNHKEVSSHLLTLPAFIITGENEGYDEEFFRGLMTANGNGENLKPTPESLANSWGVDQQHEWNPNAYGSLNLPAIKPDRVKFPPGYMNGPGLMTLAAEAQNPASPWHEVGKTARDFCSVLGSIVSTIKAYLPSCEFTNPGNRPPWFHTEDPLTVFWDSVISTQRDPIYLLADNASKESGSPAARPGAIDLDALLSGGKIRLVDQTCGSVVNMPFLYNNVLLPAEVLVNPATLPTELKVVRKLDVPSYKSLKEIRGRGSREDFDKFLADIESTSAPLLRAVLKAYNTPDAVRAAISDPGNKNKGPKSGFLTDTGNKYPFAFTSESGASTDGASNPAMSRISESIDTVFRILAGTNNSPVFDALICTEQESHWMTSERTAAKHGLSNDDVRRLHDAATNAREGIDNLDPSIKGQAKKFNDSAKNGDNNNNNNKSDKATKKLNNQGYYRTPLTSTRRLLQTLMTVNRNPLIQISDYTTSHQSSIDAKLAVSYYSRAAYQTHDTLMSQSDSGRGLINTNFFSRLESLSSGRNGKMISVDYNDNVQEEYTDSKRKRSTTHKDNYNTVSDSARKVFDRVNTKGFKLRLECAARIADPLLRYVTYCVLATRCSEGSQWLSMIDNDIHVPISFILWRFPTQLMQTWILMRGGLTTGANLYGNSNFILGTDTRLKIIEGNFTFYSGAMVWRPQHVRLIENVKPEKYMGGSNCKFIDNIQDLRAVNGSVDRPSIISTAVPICMEDYPLNMSIIGRLPIPTSGFSDHHQPITYPSCQFYKRVLHLEKLFYGSMDLSANYGSPISKISPVARPGDQFEFDPSTDTFRVHKEGKGHRSGKVGRGAARVWNGDDKAFPIQNWSSYILK